MKRPIDNLDHLVPYPLRRKSVPAYYVVLGKPLNLPSSPIRRQTDWRTMCNPSGSPYPPAQPDPKDEEQSRADRREHRDLIEVPSSTPTRRRRCQPQQPALQHEATGDLIEVLPRPRRRAHQPRSRQDVTTGDLIEVLPLNHRRHPPAPPSGLQVPTPQEAAVAQETAQAARIAGIDVPGVNTILGRTTPQQDSTQAGPSRVRPAPGVRRQR